MKKWIMPMGLVSEYLVPQLGIFLALQIGQSSILGLLSIMPVCPYSNAKIWCKTVHCVRWDIITKRKGKNNDSLVKVTKFGRKQNIVRWWLSRGFFFSNLILYIWISNFRNNFSVIYVKYCNATHCNWVAHSINLVGHRKTNDSWQWVSYSDVPWIQEQKNLELLE